MRLLIVGEAPGYSEEATGQLFSGSAGKLLDSTLAEVGLKREWFFVTNAVKCRPENNRTPSAKEIRTCSSSYLHKELAVVQPHYGLVLGNGACQAIFGKKGITSLNGQTVERHGITWVAAFHPAAVLRNPRYRGPFKAALLVFARLIRDEEGVPVTQTTLVNDKESLKKLLVELENATTASIDVETWSSHPSVGRFKGGGLAWWADDFAVTTINFSFKPGYAYVLPLFHDQAKWKDWKQVRDIIKPYMERPGIEWVMHNGKYDSKCLQRIGIKIRHGFDTMGAEYALDENNMKGLGFMSTVYLAAPDYKEEVDKTNTKGENLEALAEYGGKDADYTLRLKTVVGRRLNNEPMAARLYQTLLHPADLVLTNVEYQGMPLDARKLVERAAECEVYIAEAEQAVYDIAGMEFNIGSTQQLAQVLYNHMGLPVLERTATGAASTKEGVIVQLKAYDDSGIMQKILDYRQWMGYRSRYLNQWPQLADRNWRLHANFKPYHTVTGRLSCENPNLQQVPRNPFIRGIFGGRPGWKIVDADYSQVEMRLAAHYSQDKTLMRVFHTGGDVHMEMAMAVTGLPQEEVTSEQRKMAKAINFGFLYGMGWHKFMSYALENYELRVTEAQAKAARRDYFRTYRSLPEWHERQRKKARKWGYVINAIGRKRHLHDILSTNQEIRAEAERQSINSPVQSLASDMMLIAMIELDRILPRKEARLISTVHDSILFEIREDKLDKWIPVIKDTMENLPLEERYDCLLTVPVLADVKVGDHWSEGAVEVSF